MLNPFCKHLQLRPCVRANRILNNMCRPASIPRAIMVQDAISTRGSTMPAVENSVQPVQPGEALPFLLRQPKILNGTIEQSSAFPCDTNTISVTFATATPLVANIQQKITITQLKGKDVGNSTVDTPAAGPVSGPITISGTAVSDGVVASTGTWNLDEG